MQEIFVADADELKEGDRRILKHDGHEIGVMRAQGRIVAYRNTCPHQGGPVCEGLLINKVEEVIDENRCYRGMRFSPDTLHIVCPWHGWEFNVSDGACAGDGDGKIRLYSYDVTVRDGRVYVHV